MGSQFSPSTATVRKRVVKRLDARCEITVGWYTAWLPGGTRYELRYKQVADDDAAASAAAGAGAGKGRGGGGRGKKKKTADWKREVTRGTRMTLRDLPTSARFVFSVRACNDVGWGPYSEEAAVQTPPHPAPERAVEGQA